MDSIFHDVGSHVASDDHRSDVFTRPARSQQRDTPKPSFVEYGAGWYHDDAIANERGAHAHPYPCR